MNMKKGVLGFGIIVLIAAFIPLDVLSQESKEAKPPWDEVQSLTLGWPFDKHPGFINYAQELIFYREKSKEYLDKAKEYYYKGYDCIKRYQVRPEESDPYERDAYKFDAISPSGSGVFRDFILAEYWFNKSRGIVAHHIAWDPQINSNPEYQKMVENTYKNLIFVTVYKGQYDRALTYLNEYKYFQPDKRFIEEWEARIVGNRVVLHQKFDWVFTGEQSYQYLKDQHRKFLLDIINETYSGDPKLKEELETRIYPEYIIQSEEVPPPGSEGKKETKTETETKTTTE